jgi:hypothetical protein
VATSGDFGTVVGARGVLKSGRIVKDCAGSSEFALRF